MSIFKQPFADFLKNQLKRREEAMLNRTPQDIVYINGRNSWIRMSSSVNAYIGDQPPTLDLLKNEANYDNSLAKKYILQGGVLNEGGTLKSGVGEDFSYAYSRKSAEGIDYRLGIRPMPGITGIDVKSLGAYGSLRQVTVNFNCWDIHQLEDLELLYMRPGYTVLVEWGWAPYFDEKGNLKSNVDFYDILETKPKETIWKELDEKMKKNGNYEAMFGYVKNYSWNARMDGGYDCTTEIISLGEVIESMKINYTPSAMLDRIKKNGLLRPNVTKLSGTDIDSAISNAGDIALIVARGALFVLAPEVSILLEGGKLLYDWWKGTLSDEEKMQKAYTQNILAGLFAELYILAQQADPGDEDGGAPIAYKDNKFGSTYTMFHKTINMNDEPDKGKNAIGEDDEQYYISLASLVDVINNYVVLSDAKNKTSFAPLTIMDSSYSGKTNIKTGDGYLLALAHPLQISIDPRVCLISNNLWTDGINVNLSSGTSNTSKTSGDPVVAFNHNLGPNASGVMDEYIYIAAVSNGEIKNKETLANSIKNWLQGYPNARFSDAQIEQNVKEATRLYQEKYDLSEKGRYKIKRPQTDSINRFGVTVYSEKIGQSISDAVDGFDPKTFYQLLEDDRALNLDDTLAKFVVTPDGGDSSTSSDIADGDPVKEEQDKMKDKQEDLQELAEDAKEGLQFLKELPTKYFVNDDYNTELGIIGNIFINLRMLYEMAIDDNLAAQDKKEKNEIALYDFVKSVLSKIQESIGNVNNFDLHIDPATNTARIIDVNYVDPRDPQDVYKNAYELQIHNLKSTVRSYKLESKIFPEQKSIVAIGAQVGGGALGTDTTSLVAFNRGIIDRIIPVKNAPVDNMGEVAEEAKTKADAILSNLELIFKSFSRLKTILGLDSDYDVEESSGYAGALRDLINDLKSISTSKTSNKAILPTVLSVDMDGIGGLIIGTLFRAPEDILPKGYKGVGVGGTGSNLGYIITGIGHNVGNGDWVTKIDAQTIILDSPTTGLDKIDYKNITINVNPTAEKEVVQTPTPSQAAVQTPPSQAAVQTPPSQKVVQTSPSQPTTNQEKVKATKGKVTKDTKTFREVCYAVIDNLEGGYYHPNMLKDGRVKDSLGYMAGINPKTGQKIPGITPSGETMYGLDRANGGNAVSSCSACQQFWNLIASKGGPNSWKWNYIPPDPLKTQLIDLATQIIEPLFNQSMNSYVPEKEIQDIIKSDGRLYFNFVYAQWNGPGWFKGWAKEIRTAYKNGTKDPETLATLFVRRRIDNTGIVKNKSNNVLIATSGTKISKLVGLA